MASILSLIATVTLSISAVSGQRTYGYNHRDVIRDNDAIAKHFPDVDIKLFSPAFAAPETVPESFHLGKTGPTNETVLCTLREMR